MQPSRRGVDWRFAGDAPDRSHVSRQLALRFKAGRAGFEGLLQLVKRAAAIGVYRRVFRGRNMKRSKERAKIGGAFRI